MSGALKAGLLFGFIGIFVILFVGLIMFLVPLLGLLCGLVVASAMGFGAGYVGVKWGTAHATVGTGAAAGALTGGGFIIGAITVALIFVAIVLSDPLYLLYVEEALAETYGLPSGTEVNPDVTTLQILGIGTFLAIGSCVGLIYLLFALSFGTLGSWIAVRSRPQVAEYTPQQPPISSIS